mgnify:CR=1 FL=1
MPIIYEDTEYAVSQHESVGDFLFGALLGLIGGAIIFTKVGRDLAVRAIKVGAGVTKTEIERWIEKGEKYLEERGGEE